MDVDFFAEGASEEEILRFDENNDEYSNLEGERCGICMDIVIDRGLIDCCQHWFCFTCIDNWASITNLCPLCQHAFQSITCVPVYDTIGGDKCDEDSYSRDDDWSIEGTNNTLSFPSYYIDESAVICLDGDGCKIRSESEATETNSNLDTSIACDSCDVWYHAFCVGFDTECASEDSWLCPRCVADQVPREPDYDFASTSTHQQPAENAIGDCSIEGASSGKMLVSVADDGETALVVSRVEEKTETEELSANQSILDVLQGTKVEAYLSGSVASSPMSDMSSVVISSEPCMELENHDGSLTQNTCSDLPVNSLAQSDLMIIDNQGKEEQKLFGAHEISTSAPLVDVICAGVDMMTEQEKGLPVSGALPGKKEGIVSVTDAKRNHINKRNANNGKSKARDNCKIRLKKVEVDGDSRSMHLKNKANLKDTGSRSDFEKEEVTTDIMDIVQGTGRRRLKQPAAINPSSLSSKERDHVAGLRVKKIMRRTSDDIVQNLRKEIREAVSNKSSKDVGENLFDPKLLAAFRAVVAGNTVETRKPHVDMKTKKAMFQKGKVRENLTRKIYGMGGRRKRAWTRDCEIEFWKHRCSKVSKPEKIQTLQSVLDLLRNDTDKRIVKRRKEGESTDSLLSRLYLADTSLMPRKNDIKPVYPLDAVTMPELVREQSSSQKSNEVPPKSDLSTNRVVTLLNQSSEKIISVVKGETASTKLPKSKCTEGTQMSGSGGSKASSQQEKVGVSDVKNDKRKWALEVLARKTAVTTKNVGQDTKGDSTILKGNFPQLSLLPKDMHPILAPARHNKIATAVRQTQLYRLAENFLKNIILPEMLRSAETELAVADAINVERNIADRSNSKLVYLNLCSQELLRRAHSKNNNQTTETNTSQTLLAQSEGAEVTNDGSLDPEINEALRNAGLLSDTPPSSPCEPMGEIKEDTSFLEKTDDDGPDNIFEMDSQAELDIYGDFEYSLEDDDFIGASTLKASRQLEEESKIKVVFSTLCNDKSNGSIDILYHENSVSIQPSQGSHGLLECSPSNGSLNIGNAVDGSLLQSSIFDDDEFKEPSVVECEQLYGPDPEPLFAKHLEMPLVKTEGLTPDGENGAECESRASCDAVNASEPHSEHLTENLHDSSHCPSTSANSPVHEAKDEDLHDKENNAGACTNAVANKQSGSPGHHQKDDVADKEKTANANKQSDGHPSVLKKVEAYIKEHIRPLCKSGVITVEQYRWSVKKTTEKVMRYHSKDKNANFLVKEGEKVKKLAEQYVEAAQKTPKS